MYLAIFGIAIIAYAIPGLIRSWDEVKVIMAEDA